jgi:carbon monoxide dehydrogenase subunit G
MAAQKTYTATFAIGAKLAGSFKSVMQAAHTRMRSIENAAHRMGSAFSKLGLSLSGLGALVGVLGAGKMFSSIFEGAAEAADEFLDRQRKLTVALLKNDEIRKGGLAKAKAQTAAIFEANEALAKQGVVSKELLDISAANLANSGMPPKYIVEAAGGMADLLVATRGVNASQEEMARLTKVYGVAIRTGMTRGLREYGIILTDNQQKEFKDMKQYSDFALRRYNYLKKLGAFAAGTNARELRSDQGRIHKLHTDMDEMRIRLGLATLPARAQMAEAWRGALHELEPLFEHVGIVAARVGTWVGREMADLTKRLSTPEAAKTWHDVAASIRDLGSAFGAVPKGKKDETLGTMLGDFIMKDLKQFAEDNRRLASSFAHLKQVTLSWWADFYGGLTVIKPYWDAIYNKTAEWLHLIDDDHIHAAFKKIGDDMKEFIHDPLGAIINRWKEFKGLIGLGDKNAFTGGGGGFGGHGGGAAWGGSSSAAATAMAQTAAAQMPLTPEALKAVQAERAGVVADLRRPELRNLVSATLSTEAGGAEDQKNVLEALVNRGVAQQRAGNYKGVEALIKGGFYGPYNRGETAAVMSKGLSDARSEQVGEMINQMGAGRNALGGLTDQGMVNEIKGNIKERHGEDYFGKLGIAGEEQTAAFKMSRGLARGGIIGRATHALLGERGPEAVIPLSGGRRSEGLLAYASRALGMGGSVGTHVNFTPNITIHGGATDAAQQTLDAKLRDLARDFVADFKRAQKHERRLSYEGGYG